jgi:hypothetical protein
VYSAWEAQEGEALNQVAVFCRHLLRNDTSFNNETQPPDTEVEIYLSANYARMAGILARFGISALQSDPIVLRILQSYQVACTVVDVERTQPGAGQAKVPNPRFQSFMNQCNGFETFLSAGNLQGLILDQLPNGAHANLPEWTGASKSRKAAIKADPDRIAPSIYHGMMNNPEVASEDWEWDHTLVTPLSRMNSNFCSVPSMV